MNAIDVPYQPPPDSPPTSKRDLKHWWKGFKLPSKHHDHTEARGPGIFGVPLRQSIKYANVAISLIDDSGASYIYGYVPIVVAKCGIYLKERATHVEGIFRLSGSEKRIKELKHAFDSPDRYGKGLAWDGYTVHDAATILRRYLNDLPEPVVPLDFYDKFRLPLKGATKNAVGDAEGPQYMDHFDARAAIELYKRLITQLPPLNRQLLLYILDLLAVFAAQSNENRMTAQNLAAIFQPGMLSHPHHAMAPEEYRLNQCVIIFLIEHQDSFLIGMSGTAADEKTRREIESGAARMTMPTAPPKTVSRAGLGRSASTASAGAESVKRDGEIRRNWSTSSRHSRHDTGNTTPISLANTKSTTAGLSRSNTVPSRKSQSLQASQFHKEFPLNYENRAGPPPKYSSAAPSPVPSAAAIAAPASSRIARKTDRVVEIPPEAHTSSREKKLQSLFARTSVSESDRQPNKLKKKKTPGTLPSAQSSETSLPYVAAASPEPIVTSPSQRKR